MDDRKVKCHITGEEGTVNTFVKIGKFWYKSKEVYDEDKKKKEKHRELIDYICRQFLGYGNGQPFPTYLENKLKELRYYDDDVILETFIECNKDIKYWLRNKKFNSDYNRVCYMFAIIRNKIPEVNKKYIRREKELAKENSIKEFTDPELTTGTPNKGKDISEFL